MLKRASTSSGRFSFSGTSSSHGKCVSSLGEPMQKHAIVMEPWAEPIVSALATLFHPNWFSVGARDPKLLHPEIKRGPFNSQPRSSAVWTGHHPPRLLENLSYVLSLDLFQSNRLRGFRVRGCPQDRHRRDQNVPRADDYAPLDEILQLPNVPGPLVRRERGHRSSRNLVDLLIHAASINLHKMFHQRRNVSAALPQRW